MRKLATGREFNQAAVCEIISEQQKKVSQDAPTSFRRDPGETYRFIYDNGIYLFVLDTGDIIIRDDRDLGYNSIIGASSNGGVEASFQIITRQDIISVWRTFHVMTLYFEDEDQEGEYLDGLNDYE